MSEQEDPFLQYMSGMNAGPEALSGDVVSVENEGLKLTVSTSDGEYQILHKPTGRVWSGPEGRFCSLTLIPNDGRSTSGYDTDRWVASVDRLESVEARHDSISLAFVPRNGGRTAGIEIAFTLALLSEEDLEFSYRVLREDPAWTLHSVKVVEDALAIDGAEDYAIVPVFQGEVVPVGSRFSLLPEDRKITTRTSDVVGTYTGVGTWSMAMFALVKGTSAVVVTWDDPSVEAGVVGDREPDSDGSCRIRSTVTLNRQARSVMLHFMPNAGYVEVSGYYRGIAKNRGLFDPFSQKMKRAPDLEKNVGALRFTAFPKWGRSETAGWARFLEPGQSRIDYTFDEVADAAEHLSKDLGVYKGLAIVSAWTRRDYDMDYPDVFPAAEECGGNEGLARASERVRGLGWLFGLHDNCLILFKECTSTDEADALVRIDGSAVEGSMGINAGWRMYQCCPARMSVSATKIYTQFRGLFHLNCVYTDQIAAMPVVECFSAEHPLTHQQTIDTYADLVEYQRSQVGLVFSEIADEWAVPIFDTMGIAFNVAHEFGYPIPLFELVYRECVNLEP